MTLHDRRSFLAALGASLGAIACVASGVRSSDSAGAESGASAGAAPEDGGAARASGNLGPIGVQLYTVRNEMQKDVAATLARVARIGYKEVEFAGYFGRQPTEIRSLLTANGLAAPSAHIGLEMLTDTWARTLDAAKSIGHEYLIVAYLSEEKRRTLDDYKRIAEQFNRAGQDAQRAGIKFGYHNHDFEFTKLEGGGIGYDTLLASTDPALVAFEMDLYWITKAGYDPLTYFAKYPGRFQLVHVKDSAGPPAHEMRAVGQGTIDWKRIFAQRAQAGIRHYFVEHDNPSDAFASIETSYRYLSTLQV